MPKYKEPKPVKKKLKVGVDKPITTLEMEIFLAKFFGVRANIIVPNISWGLGVHEIDLFVVRPSGYAIEVEIKVSLSDFKADFNKKHTHSSPKIREFYNKERKTYSSL